MRSTVKIWREKKERRRYLGKKGRVVSWTEIHEPPAGFEGEKYVVAVVEIEGGEKTVGQMVRGEKVKKGDRVIGVVRRLRQPKKEEVIEYGVKFRKI